jgi:hypothetical protein
VSAANKAEPAFPVPLNPGEGYSGHCPADGMTIRDYFAAKAMHQFLTGIRLPVGYDASADLEMVAARAYEAADAMLAARASTPREGS